MERRLRQRMVDKLWGGSDPFAHFPAGLYALDGGGWNSTHRYLAESVARYRPELVVEVGVWMGGSVLTLANAIRDCGCDGVVIGIDTWLGSSEHWLDLALADHLRRVHGYPQFYWNFMSNVVAAGLQDFVLPLPLDSNSAHEVLAHLSFRPDIVHLDAAHDYVPLSQDLARWWDLLRPGGMLIVDDYDATHAVWPTVGRAVDDFRALVPHEEFAAEPYKCRLVRPRA